MNITQMVPTSKLIDKSTNQLIVLYKLEGLFSTLKKGYSFEKSNLSKYIEERFDTYKNLLLK